MSENDDDIQVKIEDSFLAPWGLANEEIPFHIIWEGETDKLEITLPDEMEVVEIHNTTIDKESFIQDSKIKIGSEDLSSEGYFSAIFTIPNIHKKSAVPYSIETRFYKNDIVQNLWRETVRIIRPQIQVINHPDEIILEQDIIEGEIEIDMQYVGYGMAKVNITGSAGGELVADRETLTHDLLQAFLETGIHKQESEELPEIPNEWRNGAEISIPQEEKDDIVSEMRELVNEGEYPEEWKTDDLYDIADILEEAEKNSSDESDITSSIYEYIEMLLLSSVLNVIERHPADNVSLTSPETTIKTEAKARGISVEVQLSDKLDNNYDSETIHIGIDDRREDGGVFEATVVTNWINYEVKPKELFK